MTVCMECLPPPESRATPRGPGRGTPLWHGRMTRGSIRGTIFGGTILDGNAARDAEGSGGPMAFDDAQLPLGEGAQLRALLRLIREKSIIVYSEGPRHLATQQCRIPRDQIRDEIRKRHSLFVALASEDDQLDDEQKQEILRHDCRCGFQAPGDWQGAARELRERAGMFTG